MRARRRALLVAIVAAATVVAIAFPAGAVEPFGSVQTVAEPPPGCTIVYLAWLRGGLWPGRRSATARCWPRKSATAPGPRPPSRPRRLDPMTVSEGGRATVLMASSARIYKRTQLP
jgi:hypothetical protein